jgi:hypothetical protein
MQPAASRRRFFLVDQGLVPFALNFVLNGAIAWAMFRGVESVPFLGQSGIVGDTLITSFLLPFATCLIVTGLIHKQLASGKLHALAVAPRSGIGSFLAARGKASRGALLGVAAVALLGVPTLALLSVAGVDALAHDAFLWFKAGYAGAVAAVAQPAIAWLALASRVV